MSSCVCLRNPQSSGQPPSRPVGRARPGQAASCRIPQRRQRFKASKKSVSVFFLAISAVFAMFATPAASARQPRPPVGATCGSGGLELQPKPRRQQIEIAQVHDSVVVEVSSAESDTGAAEVACQRVEVAEVDATVVV